MTTKQYNDQLERNFKEALAISRAKNSDYADIDNPFKNFELSAQVAGITVAKGIVIRMMDKMTRISNLLEREEVVKDERIDDTLKDLMNYSNILLTYLQNK
jgi:hypothetical protein